jgi:F-type H+-transporting ATPase subunit gamma
MQAVAASKMRKAQEQAVASRPYAERAWEILTYLASQRVGTEALHPLLEHRELKTVGMILITPDRGLCAGLPTNVIREGIRFIQRQPTPVKLIAVGRKGSDFMMRYGADVSAEFASIPDQPPLTEITPIARLAIDDFLKGTFDQLHLAYARFVNTMVQQPVVQQLLPIEPATTEREGYAVEYIIEPDPTAVLGEVLEGFTVLQIYQAILDAQASEHSARMVAMRAATENAEALAEDLTLSYNRARQEAITRELLDIAGGAEALTKARAAAT